MKINYYINRFITPVSVVPVPNTAYLAGLYIFGIRLAVWIRDGC